MKTNTAFVVLVGAVYATLALPVDEIKGKTSPETTFDNEVESVHIVDSPQIDVDAANSAYITYSLFTRSNPTTGQDLFTGNAESVSSSNFNPSNQVVVTVHGFLGSDNSGVNTLVRDAYLAKGDANIIAVNWQRIGGSDGINDITSLGAFLGQFLRFLNELTGAPYTNMHLIGFSLGAHLVANAGKELGGSVARITGLDPAGSIWAFHPLRLRDTDAIYVEAIHTDPEFGIHSRVANVDFFVNGGLEQPGCLTSVCSHMRSFQFFASTVTNNHLVGRHCGSMIAMENNICLGSNLNMGNDELFKSGSGIYRVNTWRWSYPY